MVNFERDSHAGDDDDYDVDGGGGGNKNEFSKTENKMKRSLHVNCFPFY